MLDAIVASKNVEAVLGVVNTLLDEVARSGRSASLPNDLVPASLASREDLRSWMKRVRETTDRIIESPNHEGLAPRDVELLFDLEEVGGEALRRSTVLRGLPGSRSD